MSHELRSPLNAILGSSRLALADLPAGSDRRHLEHIELAANLMLRVVNDLLDLTRIEAGKLSLDPDQPLCCRALVSRVAALGASLRQGKPVRLYATVDPRVPRLLLGDVTRIEQVLLNLVANALKFTDRGRVVVDVRLREIAHSSAVMRMSVSDTGAGLSLEQMARIGKPFEQAADRSLPRLGGTGLGLAVVNRLLSMHGAALKVASVAGGGSIFWFDLTLPLAPEQPPAWHLSDTVFLSSDPRLAQTVATQWAAHGLSLLPPDQAAQAATVLLDVAHPEAASLAEQAAQRSQKVVRVSADATWEAADACALPLLSSMVLGARQDEQLCEDPDVTGLKVLVVEDNPLNQHVLREFLRRIGVDVTVVGDGGQAIHQLGQRHVDLVLLDIQLPDLSGWEVARRIRAMPHGAHMPIAFLSAHVDATERRAAREVHALACLPKPFDTARLHGLLRDVAMRAGIRQRVFKSPPPSSKPATVKPALLALFAQQWPALRAAVATADSPASLRQAVHALRGSLAVLAQPALVIQARALEEALLAGQAADRDKVTALLSAVDALLPPDLPAQPGS